MPKFTDLNSWLDWIFANHHTAIDLGLDRVGGVANSLNLTEFSCPVITVAGTNGKGSCVAILDSILRCADYRVGTFTSPHFMRFNERIKINGVQVSDEDLVAAFDAIYTACGDTTLSYFEYSTLAALYIFQQQDLDCVILEVGLGGRLDAVNIVAADIGVITTIDLDHQEYLGDTREKIALEKAGIFRQDQIAVIGDVNPPKELIEFAHSLPVKLHRHGKDFYYRSIGPTWSWYTHGQSYKELPKPPLHLQNAATALMAIQQLKACPVDISAIRQGLQSVRLTGRLEYLPGTPQRILDVAHNPEATHELASHLRNHEVAGKTIAIVGMLNDKDHVASLSPLVGLVDEWHVASLNVDRGSTAEYLQKVLQALNVYQSKAYPNVEQAYTEVYPNLNTKDRLVCFGSFHTISEIICYNNKL